MKRDRSQYQVGTLIECDGGQVHFPAPRRPRYGEQPEKKAAPSSALIANRLGEVRSRLEQIKESIRRDRPRA